MIRAYLKVIFLVLFVLLMLVVRESFADTFENDVEKLCENSNRLTGSVGGIAASRYIEKRLGDIGVDNVLALDIPMWKNEVVRCELTIDSQVINVEPCRPNLTVPVSTGDNPISGPLRYVGHGEISDFGNGSLEGAIVSMEYDAGDNWYRVFSMGAKAIVFLGNSKSAPVSLKHLGIPVNLIRVYANEDVQNKIDLRRDYDNISLVSQVKWTKTLGRNVMGYLKGTDSRAFDKNRSEMLVLSANYDTYGEVPRDVAGARMAGNISALLDAVSYYKKNRPKRDILFLFLDGRTYYHQGARSFYDVLMRSKKKSNQIYSSHIAEKEYVRNLIKSVKDTKSLMSGKSDLQKDIQKLFMNTAYNTTSDINQEILPLRFEIRTHGETPELIAKKKKYVKLSKKYNDALDAINKNIFNLVDKSIFDSIQTNTLRHLHKRLDELSIALTIDDQEKKIRKVIGDKWIVIHISYNFSDSGPSWGPVVGDATNYVLNKNMSADNPSYYSAILKAIRIASAKTLNITLLDKNSLQDAMMTRQYCSGLFSTGSVVAGTYGIYNISLGTYHDARVRDGHPSDNLENLNLHNIKLQTDEAKMILLNLANSKELSLPRVFSDVSFSKYSKWSNGKSSGYYVGLRVSGSLAEDRPADDAVLAIWPSYNGKWPLQSVERSVPGFQRFCLKQITANGNFSLVGVSKDIFTEQKNGLVLLGAMFDSTGQVCAITNQSSIGNVFRVSLFPAKGYLVGVPLNGGSELTQILSADANAPFRSDKSLYDSYENFTFFYLHKSTPINRVKVFQPHGACFLGVTPKEPYGEGFPLKNYSSPTSVGKQTAEDLWRLNETRMSLLRSKGVVNVDLEVLHSKAKQYLEKANRSRSIAKKESMYAQSTSMSRLVYAPVRTVMDDLIHAVVILLLMAIPFAFALERLLIGATSVYKRLLGFAVAFLITFGLMYFMHPGFSIASTPIIVFLAFAIILLTSLVIYIMVRKFKTEIMALQGKATSVHNSEVSKMGTMIAAVNMGMSTMRRRPVRTLLTGITCIMLTFTILCFSSFVSKVGVKHFYEGPAVEGIASKFMIRNLDYANLKSDLIDELNGINNGDLIVGEWWKVMRTEDDMPFSIACPGKLNSVFADGILGLSPREVEVWDNLASVLNGESVDEIKNLLDSGGVFLPMIMQNSLNLKKGDKIIINGRNAFFAGTLNPNRLQRLKHLDGKSILPVDFRDISYEKGTKSTSTAAFEVAGGMKDMTQRDYVRLSPNQVVIASDKFVKNMQGQMYVVSVYSGNGEQSGVDGDRMAELTSLPVWVNGSEGVERLIFTRLTEVSGGFALFIPILLGGFIIFGTLLGSITDRKKEIYTFSALGLSPGNVGFLFFAEAAVYAIIGGLGGMLLAQGLAMGASYLANMGLIQQPSINFSSTNSLFAIAIVMATVLISAIYPAIKASASANPGVQRAWKMPEPDGDILSMTFPFTVSAYDITGVVSFLMEHFKEHDDAGFGHFASENVEVKRDEEGHIMLVARVALSPFDLGIIQDFTLKATPSNIPGIDEVMIKSIRISGARSDWKRANRVFLRELRKQFLLWRTMSNQMIEAYRLETLQILGESVGNDNENV